MKVTDVIILLKKLKDLQSASAIAPDSNESEAKTGARYECDLCGNKNQAFFIQVDCLFFKNI